MTIDTSLRSFLDDELTATIALPIDHQATIHIASLVFYCSPDLHFYFVTARTTEKARLLSTSVPVTGACVVGTYNGTPYSLQMRGSFTVLDKVSRQAEMDAYNAKRGNRHDNSDKAENIFVEFIPSWARATRYVSGQAAVLSMVVQT